MARTSKYAKKAEQAAEKAPLLAGVYARLSIEDHDDEEQNSIGNQKKIARSFVECRDGFTIVDYYADNGFSGMNFNRPDFQRMMDDLRCGRINCVIVKDISRLGRHFIMTSEIVEKVFPTMGVRLICVNDDYDSDNPASDSQSLLMPFKMVMNDSYVRDVSRKIRSSISSKMENGSYLPAAGSIPYGYLRNAEENTYDIDEETAPVIRRIFRLRADGMSLTAIAKTLNDEGLPCPGRLRYLRGLTTAEKYRDALWVRGTLRKILQDQVYIGNRVHGKLKRDKLGAEKTWRSEDEWQIIKNAHPAIVPKKLFQSVQKVSDQARKKVEAFQTQQAPLDDQRELLRDKVCCGDCGSTMQGCKGVSRRSAGAESVPFIYFDCSKYIETSRKACATHYIRQEQLMAEVEQVLNRQATLAQALERRLVQVKAMPEVMQYHSDLSARLTGIQSARRHAEKNLEQLLMDLTLGLLDKADYLQAKKRCKEQRRQLLTEERQTQDALRELDDISIRAGRWIGALQAYQQQPMISRKLLDQLIDRILIYPGRRITVRLKNQDPSCGLDAYLSKLPEVREHAG